MKSFWEHRMIKWQVRFYVIIRIQYLQCRACCRSLVQQGKTNKAVEFLNSIFKEYLWVWLTIIYLVSRSDVHRPKLWPGAVRGCHGVFCGHSGGMLLRGDAGPVNVLIHSLVFVILIPKQGGPPSLSHLRSRRRARAGQAYGLYSL